MDWFRVSSRIFTLLLIAVFAVTARQAPAQQATVAELRRNAFDRVGQGDFEGAIPEFRQLIEIQGESRLSQVIAGLEVVYYYLAISYFFSGQFGPAEEAFQTYVKKYPRGAHTHVGYVYIGDALRFNQKFEEAIRAYEDALRRFNYTPDLRTDIYAATARCYLAMGDWDRARTPLMNTLFSATDMLRRAWAATLLATANLKTLDVEQVFIMVPYLLQRDSLASRSIAFNLAAIEAGDELFAGERYREALWVHRLVYPHDEVLVRSQAYLEYLQRQAAIEMRQMRQPRRLMRLQEAIGEVEAELAAILKIDNYDVELYYRIARGYMEHQRYREARELFLHLHNFGGADKAEEALYLAFQCAAQVLPWERAYAIGRDYMEKFPSGEWYDSLTLVMGQMYAREQDWIALIRHLSHVLEVRPNHAAAAECLFLIGYASFMEEMYEAAAGRFLELRSRFPQSELLSGAIYWTAMAHLFDTQYEAASRDFDEILSRFPDTEYAEDAAFRRAVCNYALAQYELADQRLTAFLEARPESRLAAEAWMMRGDIAGALGRIEAAVQLYQQAMAAPEAQLNIELYNHSAFQSGQILYDAERYDELRTHFLRYIERDREESNIPLAVYWVGKALWQKGEREGAMRYYRETMTRFGTDRSRIGVDLILDEWIANARQSPTEEAQRAWADLQQALRDAIRQGDRVTTLRLQRMLLFHPAIQPSERERMLNTLLQPENIEHASPAVLQVMLDEALTREQFELAEQIAEEIIREFTETDYALDARMTLARKAIREAESLPPGDRARTLLAEAERHLNVIRTVFAASDDAGRALLLLGEIFRSQRNFAKADEMYRDVLANREWRHLWAEALFGRGLCAETQRDFLAAAAYYERIYLLYSHYRDWAAKAYLRRADALRQAYEEAKSRETLEAFVAQTDFAEFPEYQEALQRLQRAGGNAP